MSRTVTVNRSARHEYFVIDTYEAGIELFGTEIKSVRNGNVNLKESWADIQDGEIYVYGMHISPYEKGNIFNKDPFRPRKLLLHRKEIDRIQGRIKQEGFTLIPLSLYFKKQYIKVELGLCKGKKLYDKRETRAKRDAQRTIDRVIKERYK